MEKQNNFVIREKSPRILDPFRIFVENKKEKKGKENEEKNAEINRRKKLAQKYTFFQSRFASTCA